MLDRLHSCRNLFACFLFFFSIVQKVIVVLRLMEKKKKKNTIKMLFCLKLTVFLLEAEIKK